MVEKVKQLRSYGQFCGLARALDAVGDRWNLLIVRDLLVGPMRFTELRTSLHGIATNLLTERLRSLEAVGIVAREASTDGPRYALTPWGQGLRAPIEALAGWAMPLMAAGQGDDAFEPRWLGAALPGLLRDVTLDPPAVIGFEVDGYVTAVRIDGTGPHALPAGSDEPVVTISAPPEVVVALAAGALTVDDALEMGSLRGDGAVLRGIFTPDRSASRSTVRPDASSG